MTVIIRLCKLFLIVLLPLGTLAQTIQTDRIPGGMRGPYCLRIHKGGDLDFGGMPEFSANVYVQLSDDRKRVELRTFLNGYEPGNDQSWGANVAIEYLWEAPPGARLRKLSKVYPGGNREQGVKFHSRWVNYTAQAEAENQMLKPPPAVKRFYVVPNVPGPDITPGANPDCSQKANARFDLHDFEVEYELPAETRTAATPPPPSEPNLGKKPEPRQPGTAASPEAVATGIIRNKAVIIRYGKPALRGRDAWSTLSPFGKLWRTGANAATTIEFGQDVVVGGQPLKAGKYAFFTIPDATTWTLIFNRVAEQWGAFKYDPAQDALRLTLVSRPHELTEQLTFDILPNGFQLLWADAEVFCRVD